MTTPTPASKEAIEVAARIWCRPEFRNYVMDPAFCEAIAQELTAFAERAREDERRRAIDASGFVEKARREALLEAAEVAESIANDWSAINAKRTSARHVAKAIRALAGKKEEGREG